MNNGDRVKTPAYVRISDKDNFLFGKIESVKHEQCLDGTIFEKIMVKFENGQTLPCLREELTKVEDPAQDLEFHNAVMKTLKIVPKAFDTHGEKFNCNCHYELTDSSYIVIAEKYGISLEHAKESVEKHFGFEKIETKI